MEWIGDYILRFIVYMFTMLLKGAPGIYCI